MENLRRWNWKEGRKEFQEAIRIDSTFAMGHCYLAFSSAIFKVTNPLSDLARERENMRLANKYSQKATDRERDIINTYSALIKRDYHSFLARRKELAENYPGDKEIYFRLGTAYYLTGNNAEAVEAYHKVLEIDPNLADTYNMLSYNYSNMNQHEKAISAVRNYIALQPDVSNTYDSAFEIYLMAGLYDEAFQVCEDALKINPQWTQFRQYETYIHLFRGEGDKAREKNSYIAKLDPSRQLNLIDDLGCFNMYEGRYSEAAAEFQKVIDLAHKKKNTEREIDAHLVLGRIYNGQRKFSEAKKECSLANELSKEVYGQSYNTWPVRADYYSGVIAIHHGDYSDAMAAAERIKDYIVNNQYDDILMDYHYLLLSEIYMVEEQFTAAANMIDKISGFTQRNFPLCRSLTADLMGRQGRYKSAIHVYQEFYDDWKTTGTHFGGDFFDYFLQRSLVHYRMAQLYEKMGDRQQAILYYQKVLDQWKNADEDLPELIVVKAKLSGKD
jgi:tetratricopeptide (TPR) repeat protein